MGGETEREGGREAENEEGGRKGGRERGGREYMTFTDTHSDYTDQRH